MGPRALVSGTYRLLTKRTLPETKVGWRPIDGVLNSVANVKQGLAVLGLSIKRDGKPKGYDRYVSVHAPSVTVLVRRACSDGIERYGFIQMERAYRPRLRAALLPPDGRGYIQRLCEDGLWEALMAGPGTVCTELVGGMIDPSDCEDASGLSDEDAHRQAVIRAAKREVKEEMGIEVEVVEDGVFVDRICPDPAHALHPQSVVIARATKAAGRQDLGEDESSKKVVWYSLEEVVNLLHRGDIDDGRVPVAFFFAGLLKA